MIARAAPLALCAFAALSAPAKAAPSCSDPLSRILSSPFERVSLEVFGDSKVEPSSIDPIVLSEWRESLAGLGSEWREGIGDFGTGGFIYVHFHPGQRMIILMVEPAAISTAVCHRTLTTAEAAVMFAVLNKTMDAEQ